MRTALLALGIVALSSLAANASSVLIFRGGRYYFSPFTETDRRAHHGRGVAVVLPPPSQSTPLIVQ